MPNPLTLASFNPDLPDRGAQRDAQKQRQLENRRRLEEARHTAASARERMRRNFFRTLLIFFMFLIIGGLGISEGRIPLPPRPWTYRLWQEWTLEPPWTTFSTGVLLGALSTLGALCLYRLFVHWRRYRVADRALKKRILW